MNLDFSLKSKTTKSQASSIVRQLHECELIAAVEIKWQNCYSAAGPMGCKQSENFEQQHCYQTQPTGYESCVLLSGMTFSISQLRDPRCLSDLYQSA